jgi:hypothetical protein
MPSLRMRDCSVVRFMPKCAAVPLAPPTTWLLDCQVARRKENVNEPLAIELRAIHS